MNFNDSRVLITGGARFTGSNVTKIVFEAGAEMTILDDFSTGSMWNIREILNYVTVVEGDISDFEGVKKAVADMTETKEYGFQPKIELKTGLIRFMHWHNTSYLQEQGDL
jgi:UDP-glucose 4-epimerase